jgi:hypothetical protein
MGVQQYKFLIQYYFDNELPPGGSFCLPKKEASQLDNELFRYFITQGPFAVLFVLLLIYVMRSNEKRETRLQDLLDKFSEKYDVIISEIRDIKERFK